MSVTVVNLQRKIPLDSSKFRTFCAKLRAEVDEAANKEFAVAFISDRRMTELNKFFRGKDTTTDVLSFPHEADEFEMANKAAAAPGSQLSAASEDQFLGDIVVSIERAATQAEENGLQLDGEIKQLVLHGLLHLCGYDHETDNGEMNTRELQLREQLGI